MSRSPSPSQSRHRETWRELAALAAVAVVAYASWLLISGAATAMYRQFEKLGDPPLVPCVVDVPGGRADAGWDVGGGEGTGAGTGTSASNASLDGASQLGHYSYFWSEMAFHYRCALMFAVDNYQDATTLRNDTWQQHPGGVNAWREYALLMEPVYGFLYRVFGDQRQPFVEFLLRLVPLIQVLLFFPLYAIARALGVGRPLAVCAVLLFASCTGGFSRLLMAVLVKETFSLFLLATFLAAHFWAWRRNSGMLLIAASVLLAMVLASWHLSQFLLLVVILATALARVVAAERGKRPWLMPLAYTMAGLLAGMTPALSERLFVFSPPMAILYAWMLAELIAPRLPLARHSTGWRAGLLALLVLILGGLALLNRNFCGDYNHVFGLLLEKLAHGFRKPSDPLTLPFDVRVFWVAPYTTLTASAIWRQVGFHFLVMIPAVVWAGRTVLRIGTGARPRAWLLATLMFLVAWIFVERLGAFFLLFGSVTVALAGQAVAARLARGKLGAGRSGIAVIALLLVTPLLNLNGNLGGMIRAATATQRGQPPHLDLFDQDLWRARARLFSWVIRNTPGPGSQIAASPAAFLGGIAMSPPLLLYTGRPVVLNSQFENTEIRERYRRYLDTLFSRDEKDLRDFARRHRADYLFIDRDLCTSAGRNSARYFGGLTGNLDERMNVVRLHFWPQSLRHFEPVYDNRYFRVFRVRAAGELPAAGAWERSHGGWWEPGNFIFEEGRLVDPTRDRVRLGQFDSALHDLRNDVGRLHRDIEAQWQRENPGAPDRRHLMALHHDLVLSRLFSPDSENKWTHALAGTLPERQARVAGRLAEVDPKSGLPLGTVLENLITGRTVGGQNYLELLLSHTGDSRHLAAAAHVLALAERYEAAAGLLARAVAVYPDVPPGGTSGAASQQELQILLWLETVRWLVAAGKPDQARQLAEYYLDRTPADSEQADFFRMVVRAGQ